MYAQGGEAVLLELVSCRGVGEVVGCCTLSGEIEGGVSEVIGCCTLSGQMAVYAKGVRVDRDVLRDMAGKGANEKGRSPPRVAPEPRPKVACLATPVPVYGLMLVNPGPPLRPLRNTKAEGLLRHAELGTRETSPRRRSVDEWVLVHARVHNQGGGNCAGDEVSTVHKKVVNPRTQPGTREDDWWRPWAMHSRWGTWICETWTRKGRRLTPGRGWVQEVSVRSQWACARRHAGLLLCVTGRVSDIFLRHGSTREGEVSGLGVATGFGCAAWWRRQGHRERQAAWAIRAQTWSTRGRGSGLRFLVGTMVLFALIQGTDGSPTAWNSVAGGLSSAVGRAMHGVYLARVAVAATVVQRWIRRRWHGGWIVRDRGHAVRGLLRAATWNTQGLRVSLRLSTSAAVKLEWLATRLEESEVDVLTLQELTGSMFVLRTLRRWLARRGYAAAVLPGNGSKNGVCIAWKEATMELCGNANAVAERTLAARLHLTADGSELGVVGMHGCHEEEKNVEQLRAAMVWLEARNGGVLMGDINRVPCVKWRRSAHVLTAADRVLRRWQGTLGCACCADTDARRDEE